MEVVDHIHVIQIGSCRFVSYVHGVLQRKIPHGEGLELGVARLHATLVFVVELGKAGCHFAATGTGSGDQHQGTGGFNIFVFAESLFADDFLHIIGVTVDGVVTVALNAQRLQTADESVGNGLCGVLGDADTANHKAHGTERIGETEHFVIVSDAQVAAFFIFFNIACVNGENDFDLIFHLREHTDLAVGLEAGKNTGSVIVVKELATQFQI